MALYPLDDDQDAFDLAAAVREFLTFGLFISSLLALLFLADALINQVPG